MSELRYDPLTRRWVIIAEERGARPTDFLDPLEKERTRLCPFCEGQEADTPPEIWTFRQESGRPNSPGWSVRVVPNKFPALSLDVEGAQKHPELYKRMNGLGAHEVVIETPGHDHSLADIPNEHFRLVLQAYRERMRVLYRHPDLKYVLIFKNHGRGAGATLTHPHSQIIATPVIPRNVSMKMEASQAYFAEKQRCLVCDILKQEKKNRSRIITERAGFIAFAPYASRFPFEVSIAPLIHGHDFSESSEKDLDSLAHVFKDVLFKLKTALDDPPFNFVMFSSPQVFSAAETAKPDIEPSLYTHWHIEIIPRLTQVAGFEWGSGFFINPLLPESAARYLRDSGHRD